MVGMKWPGDENESGETRFRFSCDDPECKGHETFFAVWDTPPALIPSGMPCPFEGDHDADWIVPKFCNTHIAGGDNPFYTTVRANAEHKWMGYQIEEAKKAVDGDDQISGKAASPYGKRTLNVEKALEQGVIKKASEQEAADRKRLIDDRAKLVADKAKDQLTPIEQKHVGRRHDG